jgi:hypothetical protein
MASEKKDSLLQYVDSPRIIFVGGSNLSFGLNSQMIKDSLNINPINTAIHAGIGLRYMIENTLQYIKEDDIIVLVPEYSHFYNDYNKGSEELLRVIFDANKTKIKLLSFSQIVNIQKYVPRYISSKIKKSEYKNQTEDKIYGINSFNEYGDTFTHWIEENEEFDSTVISGDYNPIVMDKIKKFENSIKKKKAILFISFPGYQEKSYLNSIDRIDKVETELLHYGFLILGSSRRYMMNDSLMFNTSYHLNKSGVDHRTDLLIEDIKALK